MRQIKFRVWDNEKKEMHIGTSINHWTIGEIEKNKYPNWFFMQFTGLHDKNGKEIMELDLVKVGDEIWKVIFGDGGAWGLEKLDGIAAPGFYNFYLEGRKYDVEIIGNIYENPELLPVKE